ncbi:ABC transporter permease [Paenibacillus hunanensis]|uniref:ABC transporter permease n=1 Tax=Paenibacillus hunanensis TaxID=539262 RepID=UPI002026F71F|nr:ABC transporter permease [Paenibacillus hunanensis]MCL9659528.1 ABC transporter permease [Paenibacillus hunanensis]
MIKYVAKRLLIACCTLLVILFILFAMMEWMPGTPFNDDKLTAQQLAQLNSAYGLDKPVPIKFVNYVIHVLKGDFGVSYVIQKNMPIASLIQDRLLISFQIGLQAIALGVVIGLLLGIISALRHSTIWDTISSLISMLGASIPSYVFALGLMYFFAFKLGWFPVLFSQRMADSSTILPSIALAMLPIAKVARFTRNEMIEALQSDYIQLAQSKGINSVGIIVFHALRNTLIPLLTVIAPMVVGMMMGSMVIENIFAIPGIGNLFITAIQVNDYNVAISIAFIYSILFIGMMLLVDVLYGLIDPRIRLVGGEKA